MMTAPTNPSAAVKALSGTVGTNVPYTILPKSGCDVDRLRKHEIAIVRIRNRKKNSNFLTP
jgi:hypothetical protein